MNSLKRIARIIAGISLLLLGVIGLFLPVLQGILFIGLGLLLLAKDIPCLERALDRLFQRYPILDPHRKKRHSKRGE